MDDLARDANGNDAEDHENNHADEEDPAAGREIPLGLHGKDGESQADGSADSGSNQHILRLGREE